MSRRLRFFSPGATVEVVTRCLNGMYLLPSTRYFSRVVAGVLAKAQEMYPVKIHAAVMLSSHYHLILTIQDSQQLADFMRYFNGNLSSEVRQIIGWHGTIWESRYHATEITHEEGVMEARLRYVLAHSVKEGLVERISDWEGLHCGPALAEGRPIQGVWFDRTTKYNADRDNKNIERDAWVQDLMLRFDPLPCWKDLSGSQRRRRAQEMIAEIEANAAETRIREVVGMARVQAQDHREHAPQVKRSPAPLVHAGSKKVRDLYRAAYREFEKIFRKASVTLRKSGELKSAIFPRWSFPPALTFVRQGDDLTLDAVLAAQIA